MDVSFLILAAVLVVLEGLYCCDFVVGAGFAFDCLFRCLVSGFVEFTEFVEQLYRIDFFLGFRYLAGGFLLSWLLFHCYSWCLILSVHPPLI